MPAWRHFLRTPPPEHYAVAERRRLPTSARTCQYPHGEPEGIHCTRNKSSFREYVLNQSQSVGDRAGLPKTLNSQLSTFNCLKGLRDPVHQFVHGERPLHQGAAPCFTIKRRVPEPAG